MNDRTTELEYVPRELFDVHLQNIRDRANSDKELSDEKFDKLQMILEKNLAEYKTLMERNSAEFRAMVEKNSAEFKTMIAEVNGRIDVLDEKLEHTTDTLTVAIGGLEKRMDDMQQSMSLWLTVFGILAAVVPIAVAVVQGFMK